MSLNLQETIKIRRDRGQKFLGDCRPLDEENFDFLKLWYSVFMKDKISKALMKGNPVSVNSVLERAQRFVESDKSLSTGARAMIELLIFVLGILINKGTKLNSTNSSTPPSLDPNREKKPRGKTGKNPGGQKGHKGKTLEMVDNPDKVVPLKVNPEILPKGEDFKEVGIEKAQVVDIEIRRIITEYQAQILEDTKGKIYKASFPEGVQGSTIQYGASVKSHAVYMSQFQMLPYGRLEDYFEKQMGLPLSKGSLYNFNKEAYERLEDFEATLKKKLLESPVLNVDETSVNISSHLEWIHTSASPKWTHFYHHKNRGTVAMNEEGVIPNFKGTLVHDHLKAYYTYTTCKHALCNAHHLRELQGVIELNGHQWAKDMQDLLKEINDAVSKGSLTGEQRQGFLKKYDNILEKGDEESPSPIIEPEKPKKRGKQKKEKHRNLLERLRNYKEDVLRFMNDPNVPFTNNMAENDLRMIKVHQKISGCFRSETGAKIFCRIRSYLLSAQKQDVNPADALTSLFQGNLHPFCLN